MNKYDVVSKLSTFIIEHNVDVDGVVKNAQWNGEESKESDILFYQLGSDKESYDRFKQRISKYQWGILVLGQRPLGKDLPANTIIVKEDYFMECQKIICDDFYPFDQERKKIVGVTGTNGKTTTAYLAMQISNALKVKAFYIGTLGIITKDKKKSMSHNFTTPPYIELRKIIHQCFLEHDVCFIEVSSHALVQERVYKIDFDAAAWTSFSQDHLDYHGDMDNYFKSKKKIIDNHLERSSLLYIPQSESDLKKKLNGSKKIKVAKAYESWGLGRKLHPFYKIDFNRANLELSLSVNEHIGTKIKLQDEDINMLKRPPGRFDINIFKSKIVIIDYAHTPSALTAIGESIRKSYPKKKIYVVFGCGGDRDRGKRRLMGEAVDRFADAIYVTSDNPRSENPRSIIEDILAGIKINNPDVVVDRRSAITTAFKTMGVQDILLIAGKGHEDYQEIMGKKIPFSDIAVIKDIAYDCAE